MERLTILIAVPTPISRSDGVTNVKCEITTTSVFDELELDPGKAEQLKLKAALFDVIIAYIEKNNLTQQQAADIMGVQRSRVGDVCRGKITGFTIDALVAMAARAGLHPLQVAA